MLGCYWHFCPCQEKKRLPFDEIEKGVKRREYNDCRRKFLLESGFKVCEIWECDWWKKVKNKVDGAGDYMKTTYPYQKPISENNLIEDIKSGLKFGVVERTERLREKFIEVPPTFKNCEVSLEDIGPHMKDFAHEYNPMKKPRRMLISSFCLQRGPVFTPLLQFHLEKRSGIESSLLVYPIYTRKMFRVFRQLGRGSTTRRRQKHIFFSCC